MAACELATLSVLSTVLNASLSAGYCVLSSPTVAAKNPLPVTWLEARYMVVDDYLLVRALPNKCT